MKRTFQDKKTFRTDEQLDGTANSLSASLEASYNAWDNTQADYAGEENFDHAFDKKKVYHQKSQVKQSEQDGQLDKVNQNAFTDFDSLT